MSRLFQKKSILQKIAIVLLITLLCYWIVPTYSLGYSFEELGGDLLKVLMQLLVGLGDIVTGGLNHFMLGTDRMISSVMLSRDSQTVTNTQGALFAETTANPDVILGLNKDANGETDEKENEERLVGGIAWDNDDWQIPNILYSPEAIFSNRVAALDVNFLNPNDYTAVQDNSQSANKASESSATFLRETIASWYAGFRNIAIVALLTVLVFLGIKMVLGSVEEKAKYKESLRDWVVALCLVFFIHFIMSGILMITQKVTDLFSQAAGDIIVQVTDDRDEAQAAKEQADEAVANGADRNTVNTSTSGIKFSENLMGLVRLRVQSANAGVAGAYFIMYFVLIGYTVMFTFTYFRRFLYMAFLTMIAPLVAITYPIDKIGDGNAQAFTMWFREYIMNAMMQPLHLVLYTALVSSATNLVVQNPIYALVAIGFLIPAEKFVKSMFGFNKASTPGTLGGFAAAAVTAGSLKSLAKGITGGGNSSSGGNNKIRTASDDGNNNYLASDDDSDDNVLAGFNGGSGSNDYARGAQNSEMLPPETGQNNGAGDATLAGYSTPPNEGEQGNGEQDSSNNIEESNGRATLFPNGDINDDGRARLFTGDGRSVVGGSVVSNNNYQQGTGMSSNDGRARLFTGDGQSVVGGSVVSANLGQGDNGNNNSLRNRNLAGMIPESVRARAGDFKANAGAMKRTVIKGVKRNAGKAGRAVWRNRGRIGRTFVRTAGAATGAIIGGTAGVIRGVMKGDPSAALTGAITGAAVAANVGNKMGDAAVDIAGGAARGIGSMRDDFREEKYGSERAAEMKKEREYNKGLRQFLHDEQQIAEAKKVQTALEKQGIKEDFSNIMKSRYDYVRAGIKNDDIKRAQLAEARNGINGNTHGDYIKVAKQAEKFGINASTFTDDKKYNELVNSMAATYGGEEQARYAISRLAELKGTEEQNSAQLQKRDANQRASRERNGNSSQGASQSEGQAGNNPASESPTRGRQRNSSGGSSRNSTGGRQGNTSEGSPTNPIGNTPIGPTNN